MRNLSNPPPLTQVAKALAVSTGQPVMILTVDEAVPAGGGLTGYLTDATGEGLTPPVAMAFAHHMLDAAVQIYEREACDCSSCADNKAKLQAALDALAVPTTTTRPGRRFDA